MSLQPSDLKKFLQEKARACIHKPEGMLAHPFVTPSFGVEAGSDDAAVIPERSTVGHYLQMYDWDACFFSQAGHHIDRPDLAYAVVENFLSLMAADDSIPRTVSPHQIWDSGDLCKPFLTQTLLSQIDRDLAPDRITGCLPRLQKYLDYYDSHRRGKSGLYHWRNVLESGVDNNFALLAPGQAAKDENQGVGQFPDGRLLAVDLNSYLCAEFAAMSELCHRRGDTTSAQKYQKRSIELAELIEQQLWDNKLGMYCNLDPETNRLLRIKTWTGLLPVFLGMADKSRAQEVIERNIINQTEFLRPAGLSSVAASEPLYNQAMRGLYGRIIVSNWQGPMWVLPNVLAARGLRYYGYEKAAAELASRVVKTLTDDMEHNLTLHENYHAETGAALWAPEFMSWNILTLELIDLL